MKRIIKAILSWLRAEKMEEKKELVLIKIRTKSGKNFYRWAAADLDLNGLSYSPLLKGDKIGVIRSVELVDFSNELVKEDLSSKDATMFVEPRKADKFYRVTTMDYAMHYIWCQDSLDPVVSLCPLVFEEDDAVSDVVSIKRVPVGDSFIFNAKVWDLRKDVKGHQCVVKSKVCPEDV